MHDGQLYKKNKGAGSDGAIQTQDQIGGCLWIMRRWNIELYLVEPSNVTECWRQREREREREQERERGQLLDRERCGCFNVWEL